ncbi:hypothetical protein R1flu_001969 [Riccia fluitans]|uniref:Uncharacterized protein n=1 Tax=Riccia fluitans TaxID=41844 RepID=A0ABD1Y4S5_9MARC
MAAVRRMCAGGIQVVRIVYGDGQVLSFAASNVKVADVLTKHPHHYICHRSPDKSSMLPLDAELEPGSVYFLLPLPRLFPSSGSGSNTNSPSCSCYIRDKIQNQEVDHHHRRSLPKAAGGALKQIITRIGSPMRSPKKISPEISRGTEPCSKNPYSPNYGKENSPLLSPVYKRNRSSPKKNKKSSRYKSRADNPFAEDPPVCNRWKPRLGCISETDAFVTACEELRLSLDRRRLTFESRGRPSSPLRYGDLSRSPSRSSAGGDYSRSPSRSSPRGDYSRSPSRPSSASDYCRSPSRELKSTSREPYTPRQSMSLAGYLLIWQVTRVERILDESSEWATVSGSHQASKAVLAIIWKA